MTMMTEQQAEKKLNNRNQWARALMIWQSMPRPFPDTIRQWHNEGILSADIEMKLHYIEDEFIRQRQGIEEAWNSEMATFSPDKDFPGERDKISRQIIADSAKKIAAGTASDEEKKRYHSAITTFTGTDNKEAVLRAKSIPFEKVLAHHNIALRMWKTRCMFHEERSASFSVYRRKNTAQCFGCGWHGDTIAFVQERRQVTFLEAVRYLNTLT